MTNPLALLWQWILAVLTVLRWLMFGPDDE